MDIIDDYNLIDVSERDLTEGMRKSLSQCRALRRTALVCARSEVMAYIISTISGLSGVGNVGGSAWEAWEKQKMERGNCEAPCHTGTGPNNSNSGK